MAAHRKVYIISDLHIGGEYADTGGRGFRLCTHVDVLTDFVKELTAKSNRNGSIELIINGDFFDFLAERNLTPPYYVPFVDDRVVATERLQRIVARDQCLFDALSVLVAAGNSLTILLGNHDIELALPQVRRKLAEAIDTNERNIRFVYDGEAYAIGDALIEHGNRYDRYNMVDHDQLRRLRSLQSRRQPVPQEHVFIPPCGSRLVSKVMNPIKERYSFVDLLKPESPAVIPLLLALEPGYRAQIASLLPLELESRNHRLTEGNIPSLAGDISAFASQFDGMRDSNKLVGGDIGGNNHTAAQHEDDDVRLHAALAEILGPDVHSFMTQISPYSSKMTEGDISSKGEALTQALGLAALLCTTTKKEELEQRLPALHKALTVLQNDKTFDRTIESKVEYAFAAQQLSQQEKGGFRYVIFGHTHLARDVLFKNGAHYLNTGTWADVMKFPTDLLIGENSTVRANLARFAEDLISGQLSSYTEFIPTYVCLEVDDSEHVVNAELAEFGLAGAL